MIRKTIKELVDKYLLWPEETQGPMIVSFLVGMALAFGIMVPQIGGWDLDNHLPGYLWIIITIAIIAVVITVSKIMRTPDEQ